MGGREKDFGPGGVPAATKPKAQGGRAKEMRMVTAVKVGVAFK